MAGSKRQDNNRADPSGPVDSDSDGSAVPKCGRVADQHKRFPARAVRGRVKELGDPAREGRSGEPAADHVGEAGAPAASTSARLVISSCDLLRESLRATRRP